MQRTTKLLSLLLTAWLMISASFAAAEPAFSLAGFRDLREKDPATAVLILQTMREAIFYARESVGDTVICASPVPIPGERIAEMLEKEIAKPTNQQNRPYDDRDPLAFVLLHALRSEGVCR